MTSTVLRIKKKHPPGWREMSRNALWCSQDFARVLIFSLQIMVFMATLPPPPLCLKCTHLRMLRHTGTVLMSSFSQLKNTGRGINLKNAKKGFPGEIVEQEWGAIGCVFFSFSFSAKPMQYILWHYSPPSPKKMFWKWKYVRIIDQSVKYRWGK